MVLIISEDKDQSTHEVIDWISHYKHDFIRVNPENKITEIDIENGEVKSFSTSTHRIEMDQITSVWYRRGYFNFQKLKFPGDDFPFKKPILNYERKEENILNDFLFRALKMKRSLGDFHNTDVNKLNNLVLAKKIGLKVPETIVTSQSKELRKFIRKHSKVITKSIGEVVSAIEGETVLTSYTARLENADDLDDFFFPSLFQQEIPKKYELRVFYLKGVSLCMAIFSQEDQQTAVDFRHYNSEKPNRVIPFKLPEAVAEKLHQFMVQAKYDTGSVDFIVTPSGEYYFLEVNPVGQFGMVSYPCNYGLEKRIAEYLCNIST